MLKDKYDADIQRLRGMNSMYFPRIEEYIKGTESHLGVVDVEFVSEGMTDTHHHGEAMMSTVAVVFKFTDADGEGTLPKQIRTYVTEEDEDGGNLVLVQGGMNVRTWSQYPEKVI